MSKYKILLVDDSENVVKALRRTFLPEGFRILTAASAQEAMAILEREEVDVVISDENMPGLSGTDFLRMVKMRCPETVRIMLTGVTDLEVVKSAINTGEVYKFFNKPWDDFELVMAVKHALHQKMIERENKRLHSIIEAQQEVLRKLEQQYPGITKKNVDADGSLIIEKEE